MSLSDALKQVAQWETFVAPVREPAPVAAERIRPGGGGPAGAGPGAGAPHRAPVEREPVDEIEDLEPGPFPEEEVEDAAD